MKYFLILLTFFLSIFNIGCSDKSFITVVDSSLYYNDTIISAFGYDTVKISPYQTERELEMPYSYILLKIFSIHQDRIPNDYHQFASPSLLYESIVDTLKGGLYTQYVPKSYASNFLSQYDIPKNYYFGFAYSSYNDTMFVTNVFKDSPADSAGLIKGDKIIQIDNYPINSNSAIYNAVVSDNNKVYSFIIKRDSLFDTVSIKKENVTLPISYGDSLAPNIGYVYLSTFIADDYTDGGSSYEQFYQSLKKVSFAKNIIIDLRNNTGGYIDEAFKIARLFLNKNDTLIGMIERQQNSVDNFQGEWDTTFYHATKDGEFKEKNIVILQNGLSASASEILISCLKDNKNATLIGTNSYGKALGQVIFTAKNGGVAKITSLKLITKDHKSYAHVGITPDIVSYGGYNNFIDITLNEAIEFINNSGLLAKKSDYLKDYNYYNPILENAKDINPFPELGIKSINLDIKQ